MSLHEERLLPQIKRRNHNRFVARISILCGFCGRYLNGTCGLNRIEPGNTVDAVKRISCTNDSTVDGDCELSVSVYL